MVAYEFYCNNDKGEEQLIGILPERRKNPDRITTESIMDWVRKILSDDKDFKKIYFNQVEV